VSDRSALRRELIDRRRALPADVAAGLSSQVVVRLRALPEIARLGPTDRLGAYCGRSDEVSVAALTAGTPARVYLPVVTGWGRPLEFARFRPGDRLTLSRYGIPEPRPAARRIAPERLDVVVVPAVGLDRHGHRLGHGAGYYDRTFAAGRGRRPVLVGVVFSFALLAHLEAEPWDVPVDIVVTDREVIRPRGHSTRAPRLARPRI
jgi:5-formyltetrahydrofolate cyclo-ligase